MKIKSIVIIAFCIYFTYVNASEKNAPSFDCNLAQSEIEKFICNSDVVNINTLRLLDVSMSNTYKAVRKSHPEIKTDQIKWLKLRNSCNNSEDHKTLECLINTYNNRLSELLTKSTSHLNIVNKDEICSSVTGRACHSLAIQEFSLGNKTGFFFNNIGRSYLIELNNDGSINWESSWSGDYIGYISSLQKSYWKEKSKILPEFIVIKKSYRSGCPDCGTQNSIFIKINNKWTPINLTQFYARLGMISGGKDELYMDIDDTTGIITITAAFSDYREAQVEDLSYMTATGILNGNVFKPTNFKLSIR